MNELVEIAVAYARAEPLVAGAAGLLLLYLAARKTKLLLFLVALALVVAGALFVISEMTGAGGSHKSRLYEKGAAQDSR